MSCERAASHVEAFSHIVNALKLWMQLNNIGNQHQNVNATAYNKLIINNQSKLVESINAGASSVDVAKSW